MAKGTTVKMWRRTLIVLIVMVALGFGLIVVSLIRLQLVDGAELQKACIYVFLHMKSENNPSA